MSHATIEQRQPAIVATRDEPARQPSTVAMHDDGPRQLNDVVPHDERPTGHPVDPRFVRRWSPRSFRGDPVPHAILWSMLEAARWAPSSYNAQPWRFFATTKGPVRDAWNEAVLPFNRAWSDHAGALVWVVARSTMGPAHPTPQQPNAHAWFDTGAAALQLVLEAERHGLRAHSMGGIDAAKAHALLGLDADHQVICAIAVGYQGNASDLPERLRGREQPSSRLPLEDVARIVD